MPYITPERREEFSDFKECIKKLVHKGLSEGDLNYLITLLLHTWLKVKEEGVRYKYLNLIIGVLECAKLEFYRQIASPYEDEKKANNGSVSFLDIYSKF